MIIQGKFVNRNYDNVTDHLQGLKERIFNETHWMKFLAQQTYSQFTQLQDDYRTGVITEDIYRQYLPIIADFFKTLNAPREIGCDYKDVAEAYAKLTGK